MDCEKCDDLLMDELYGELDDVTRASVRRHVAGCARCSGVLADLKGTRDLVSSLPIVAVPPSLEERIFAAEKEATKVVPIRRRASTFVSVAGRWAMRPQTAMAALFLLMIGSTTFFLKGRGATHASAPITVAQEGAPVAAAPTAQSESLAPNAARGAHGPLEAQPVTTPPPAASAAQGQLAASDDLDQPAFKTAGKDRGDLGGDKALALAKGGAAKPDGYNDEEQRAIGNAGLPAGAPMPTTAAPAAPPAAQAAVAGNVYDAKNANGPAGGGGAGNGSPYYSQQAQATKKEADGDDFSQGMASYRSAQYPQATQSFDRAGASGDLNAALWGARSVRDGQGCGAAIPRFENVASRGAGTSMGADAMLDAGRCYQDIGSIDAARAKYTQLLNVPSHAARAQQALNSLNQVAAARRAPAPSKPKAAAPPAQPPQAAPPAKAAPATDQAKPSDANANTLNGL